MELGAVQSSDQSVCVRVGGACRGEGSTLFFILGISALEGLGAVIKKSRVWAHVTHGV